MVIFQYNLYIFGIHLWTFSTSVTLIRVNYMQWNRKPIYLFNYLFISKLYLMLKIYIFW